ncbi:MAG: hypothetical protein V2A58_18300 [Planctomycetota bacterium]
MDSVSDPRDQVITLLSQIVYKAAASAILCGLKRLCEYVGSLRYDGIYHGAEDFWYQGIEKDGLADGAKVKVDGLISPYAPFMPSHPRAKPGYSARGWLTVSQRLSSLMAERSYPVPDDPLSSSDYDAIDLVVWGDAVLRPRPISGKRLYAGFYNQYGKSFECVPLFIDPSEKTQRECIRHAGWNKPQPSAGTLVSLSGMVRKMPSYYDWIGLAHPIETSEYPCYCIEVTNIKVLEQKMCTLYATAWLERRKKGIVTEFFDFLLPAEYYAGHRRLQGRGTRATPLYYYDHLACPYPKYPQRNAELDDALTRG